MADLSDIQAANVVKVVGSDSTGVEQTPVQSTANGALHSNLRDNSGNELATTTNSISSGGSLYSSYSPDPSSIDTSTKSTFELDASGRLETHSTVTSDEGTFRDDFSGAAIDATKWTSATSGSGSISVNSSLASIAVGTGSTASASIITSGDYGPISFRSSFSITGRNNNQTVEIGFKDSIATPSKQAIFRFTGTTNTTLICVTSSSSAAADTQTSTITIPNGTSAASNDYYIEVQSDQVAFIINGIQVALHKLHIPGPYDVLNLTASIANSAFTTANTLALDYIYFINQDSLQINNSFIGDPMPILTKTGIVQTYGAAQTALNISASATDIFTITGSATKAIKIKHISLDATQTTAGVVNVLLIKRSTANSGGTSTTLTNVPFDSFNAAATATVRSYTANPTVGNAIGTMHSEKLFISTTSGAPDELKFDYTENMNMQEIVLRGTNEVLALNLNSQTVSGGSFNIDVTWIEE